MDLSFRLVPAAEVTPLAADLALLMAMVGDRQASSATAHVQGLLGDAGMAAAGPLAPPHGAFNAAMANRIAAWKQE